MRTIEFTKEVSTQRERPIALTGFRLSLVAAAALVLSPIGYRLGWWDVHVALMYLVIGGTAAAIVALIISLIATIQNRPGSGKEGFFFAVSGVFISIAFAGYPVTQIVKSFAVPQIHDISTDTYNPPRFVALASIRKVSPNGAEYGGPRIADQQNQAYPDITSYQSSLPPDQLFAKAATIVLDARWQITVANPTEGRLEATDTTLPYGFKDDVVIRVIPDATGSRLDIRSASRVGLSDLGVNAARIRKFLLQLKVSGA